MSNSETNGLLLCDTRPASSRIAGQVVIQVGKTLRKIALVLAYSIIGSLPSFGRALRKLGKGRGEKYGIFHTLYYLGTRCTIDL